MDWPALESRARARVEDGERRLPSEPARREKQLVRMAMAAGAAGLACLMDGRPEDAVRWHRRAAELYRESWADAPAGSWGRLVGALKSRLLAGDAAGAAADARWALAQGAETAPSPIGSYAAALARLALGEDDAAAALAASLAAEEAFPHEVAGALAALARRDAPAYERAVRAVLASFEGRDAFLEDVPVADTVLALEALAEPRSLAARPASRLLPGQLGGPDEPS